MILSFTSHPEAGGSSLFVCPWLRIQYIPSPLPNAPRGRAMLWLQRTHLTLYVDKQSLLLPVVSAPKPLLFYCSFTMTCLWRRRRSVGLYATVPFASNLMLLRHWNVSCCWKVTRMPNGDRGNDTDRCLWYRCQTPNVLTIDEAINLCRICGSQYIKGQYYTHTHMILYVVETPLLSNVWTVARWGTTRQTRR
jgi:hypothetical protein